LADSNLRMAFAIAKKFQNRGVTFLDLIQDGNEGLLKAVRKYDPDKINKETGRPYKFSTYATWWVRQTIFRGLANTSRTIRFPVHIHDQVLNYRKKRARFFEKESREPTNEELANELGEDVENVKRLGQIIKNQQMTASLNLEVGGDLDVEIGDFVPDRRVDVEEAGIKGVLAEQFNEILATCLKGREKEVLELRFGLKGGYPRSLEEVGREFGVTRERIRQIQSRAFERIRNVEEAKKLAKVS